MYYRNAQAAVVVYDVTKATSLEKAKTWVKELQRQANPNIVIALAGNKIDLVQPSTSTPTSESSEPEEEADDATATPGENGAETGENLRQVPRDEAEAYAQEAGLLFFETSAKTGEGIVEIFTEIGACLLFCSWMRESQRLSCLQPRRFPLSKFWHPPVEEPVEQVQLALVQVVKRVVSTWSRTLPKTRMVVIVNYSELLPIPCLAPLPYVIGPPSHSSTCHPQARHLSIFMTLFIL